jgi:hypothetical protein
MPHRLAVSLALGVLLATSAWRSTPVDAAAGLVDPADFTSSVDNPWFPLRPGTTFTYRGTKDGKPAIRVFAVTNETKVIDGVTCVVVEDRLSLAGRPAERLQGYYAQDRDGDVWYFGEDAEELDAKGGVIKSEGWQAGSDGALPSFFMEAAPAVGHAFAHDYTKDHFQVVSLSEVATVPYGSFTAVLMTEEWNQLEDDAVAHKYYARGIGEVRDVAVRGDKEEFLLVGIAH